MRLVLHLSPNPITFTFGQGAYPYLLDVGNLRLAARAGTPTGLGVGEVGGLQVQLSNDRRQVANILGRPLRVRAELFEDNDDLIFEGTVSSCTYGQIVTLELDP